MIGSRFGTDPVDFQRARSGIPSCIQSTLETVFRGLSHSLCRHTITWSMKALELFRPCGTWHAFRHIFAFKFSRNHLRLEPLNVAQSILNERSMVICVLDNSQDARGNAGNVKGVHQACRFTFNSGHWLPAHCSALGFRRQSMIPDRFQEFSVITNRMHSCCAIKVSSTLTQANLRDEVDLSKYESCSSV
jgi:hypothetical protein